MFKDVLISMRPKQWYKNLVIFIGIVFSLNLLNFNLWINAIYAFIGFCLLSGSIYIINDYLDIEKDRNHPVKCKRPLASGRLKASQGLFFSGIFIITALMLTYLVNMGLLVTSLAFFSLIIIYSLFLKEICLVDILTISTGFVLRAVAGCVAIGVLVSPWLILCTFLLALFLALGKRRHELVLLKNKAVDHRKILSGYSREMMDQMMNITTSALIMSYSIYAFLATNIYIMTTIPLAFYGIFRYLFLLHNQDMGGEPEMLFKDRGMISCMFLWVIMVVAVLYFIK